jgi:hypothetical protein
VSDIKLGVLAGQLKPVTNLDNVSQLWKGPVLLDNNMTAPNCWVKVVSLPELILECFGHLLAKEFGLPFLSPIVVTDPKNLLGVPGKLLFATEDAQIPSLRQTVNSYPAFQAIYFQALQNWKDSPKLAVLDELMANGDRNIGNLLFDGKAKWIPIDYSRSKAKGPHPMPSWDGTDDRLDNVQANHLVDIFKVLDAKNVHAPVDEINKICMYTGILWHFSGLPVKGIETITPKLAVWLNDRRAWSLRRLLGNRLSAVFGTSTPIVL